MIVTFAAGDALLLWLQRKGVLSSRSDQVGGLDQQERQLERNRSFSCLADYVPICPAGHFSRFDPKVPHFSHKDPPVRFVLLTAGVLLTEVVV